MIQPRTARLSIALTLTSGLLACQPLAREHLASIEEVRPNLVTVTEPQQVCEEVVSQGRLPERDGNIGGTVAGAVIGGLIGKQVGGGSGKKLATVAGAVAGGAVGHEIDRRHENGRLVSATDQRCRTEQVSREVQVGFEVRYRFDGQLHTVVMPEAPQGTQLRVNADGSLAAAPPAAEDSVDRG